MIKWRQKYGRKEERNEKKKTTETKEHIHRVFFILIIKLTN
jgi:hypothetical protein